MSNVSRQAAQLAKESLERFKKTLAKNGKTLDDWLEEERIRTEATRKRIAEKAQKEAAEKAQKDKGFSE